MIQLFRKIEFERNPTTLHPFSSDLRFDPFPQQIDVTNPYECTATDLRPCKMDDDLSCIGCQSLIARCTHFNRDTLYFDDDGNTHTIPKNTDPNDGYCMTIDNIDLNLTCNVYHGDLALIKISPESPASMFFCNCKNPGFIGNTSILGSCDTPFICNGRVDNINQPIEKISCECSPTQYTIRTENDIPMCVDMTVREADNKGVLQKAIANSQDLIDIGIFNQIIGANITSIDKLLHPCKFCPLTGQHIINGILGNIENESFCSVHLGNVSVRNSYFGIPYRRNADERILRGDLGGPDCVLGVYWNEIIVYDHLLSDQRQIIIFRIEPDLNSTFYRALNLDISRNYWIRTDNLLMGLHIPMPKIDPTSVPGTSCWEGWPNYDCSFSMRMMDVSRERPLEVPNVSLEYIAPNTNLIRAPPIIGRPTGPFLLDIDAWREMQNFNQNFSLWQARFGGDGGQLYPYTILEGFSYGTRRTSRFAPDVMGLAWGFRRKGLRSGDGWEYTILSNHNRNDWDVLNSRVIPL